MRPTGIENSAFRCLTQMKVVQNFINHFIRNKDWLEAKKLGQKLNVYVRCTLHVLLASESFPVILMSGRIVELVAGQHIGLVIVYLLIDWVYGHFTHSVGARCAPTECVKWP